MQIKPSSDVLQALGNLPVERAPARPKPAAVQQLRAPAKPAAKQVAPRNSVPAPTDLKPGRNYRPGTFLDIYV